MQKLLLSFIISLLFFSCKKSETTTQPDSIAGQWKWVIQRENNPAYFSTPATTGIQESLEFNANGTYVVTQNSAVVNSGTYKTAVAPARVGSTAPVSGVLYSNARVTDSVAYYEVRNTSDSISLMFCPDLSGNGYGASSRFYGRKK